MYTLGAESVSCDKLSLGSLVLVANLIGASESSAILFFCNVAVSVIHLSEADKLAWTDEEAFAVEGEFDVQHSSEHGHDLSLAFLFDSRSWSSSSSFFVRSSDLENFSKNRLRLIYLGLELVNVIFGVLGILEHHSVVIRLELNNFAPVSRHVKLPAHLGNRHVRYSTSKSFD